MFQKVFLDMTSLKYIYIVCNKIIPHISNSCTNKFSCLKPFLVFYNLILQQTLLVDFVLLTLNMNWADVQVINSLSLIVIVEECNYFNEIPNII